MTKLVIRITSGTVSANIEIERNFLVAVWTCDMPRAFGVDGGQVSSWDGEAAYLSHRNGPEMIVLYGLRESDEPGTSGDGENQFDDVGVPFGGITWNCLDKW